MRIKDVVYCDTIIPSGSCGTGYSQPDDFLVWFDNDEDTAEHVLIDIWYSTKAK